MANLPDHSLQQRWPSWVKTAYELIGFLQHDGTTINSEQSVEQNLSEAVATYAVSRFRSEVELWFLLSRRAQLCLKLSLVRQLSWPLRNIQESEIRETGEHAAFTINREAFVSEFLEKGAAYECRRMLLTYPVLLRLWSRQIDNWASFFNDFLNAASRFATQKLKLPQTAGLIGEMHPFLSDPHHGGRSVIAVEFGHNNQWHYKPRSGIHEKCWFQLLSWINQRGFCAPFRIPSVISTHQHCWVETMVQKGVSHEHSTRLYYFRSGAVLYLLHVLRGTDFHAGNLIANGDQPILVDCETILHARTRVPAGARIGVADIRRTGMLPMERSSGRPNEPSGLGRTVAGAHSLNKRGRLTFAADYVGSIQQGFASMHRFLTSPAIHRPFEARLARILPNYSRRIYRPTNHYVQLLTLSTKMGTMFHGLYHSLYLHACCRRGATPKRYIPIEVAALEDGDIPIFQGASSSVGSLLSEKSLRRSLNLLETCLAD
ncbi:MAG TPA: type 2 lanthipeptide synthetase LanM [Chthoniobacterales bacterium]|jgi:lantibiotic modifying enzyme